MFGVNTTNEPRTQNERPLQLPGVGHDAGKMFASRQAFEGLAR